MSTSTAPPLGLVPRFIVDEQRLAAIDAAILRYAIAKMDIPQEWHAERNEIVTRLNTFYNRADKVIYPSATSDIQSENDKECHA